MNKVLFISPHLDDESIGCGGTIFYHKFKGDKIYWANVCLPKNQQKRTRRLSEFNKISNYYNFNKSFLLGFVSTDLEGKNKLLVEVFSELISQIKPNIIYLPNRSDIHADHKNVFKAVYSCTKSFRFPFINQLIMYETISETEFGLPLSESAFLPNLFVNITGFFEKKMSALKIYEKEMMEENYPRHPLTIESLAIYRGSRIGVKYAEAFSMIFLKQNI